MTQIFKILNKSDRTIMQESPVRFNPNETIKDEREQAVKDRRIEKNKPFLNYGILNASIIHA